ncbi:MAG: hypothetical protein PHU23_14930 [Dehalococcoidales bacterium]|nr:hypothetical protein [Dehalococcoidales bacterium]
MNCSLCNDFGLVHPRQPDGTVDYSSLIYCRCRGEKAGQLHSRSMQQDEPERYVPVTPDMIDFPVSWDFHRHYCQYYGWPDPGQGYPEEYPPEEIKNHISNSERSSSKPKRISRQDYDSLKELNSQIPKRKEINGEIHIREDITDRLY